MGQSTVPLPMLSPQEGATVVEIRGGHRLRERLTGKGLIPAAPVRLLQNQPPGPILVLGRDARLALGRGPAHKVRVR